MSKFPIRGVHKGFYTQTQEPDNDDMRVDPIPQQLTPLPHPPLQKERRQRRDQPDRQAKAKKAAVSIPRVNASTMELESEEKAEERTASWVPKRKSVSELDPINRWTDDQLDELADQIRQEWDENGPNAKVQGSSCVIV